MRISKKFRPRSNTAVIAAAHRQDSRPPAISSGLHECILRIGPQFIRGFRDQ